MRSLLGAREIALKSADSLRLHTFGGCFLTRGGMRLDALSGQRKGLALLAVLAGSDESGVSREVLLAYLWPESDTERARTSLNQLVHSTRRQLGSPELLAGSSVLRLNVEHITSDVVDFQSAIHRRDYEAAVTLYVGPFLDGFYVRGADGFERWAERQRAELARSAARALEALAEAASTAGDVRVALDWWRRLTRAEPLSARATTGLMRALDASGDRAAALEHARVYQQLVEQELGAGPDASVAELVARLRRGPPQPSPSASPRNTEGSSRAARQPASEAQAVEPRIKSVRPSVAVLPFANTSGDAADEHFSDGLTDELISALGRLSGLRVTGRTSSFAVKARGLTVPAIGALLNVATVVEGSVRRAGNRLKVTAQLVSASDDVVLWAEVFDRATQDVFAVQEEIARAIVDALRVQLGTQSRRLVSAITDLGAYELYLKGRYLLNTRLSNESLTSATKLFDAAIARDPAYARAYAGLSDAHAYRAIFAYARPHDAFAAAKAAARRALELDDTLSEAHVSLAHALFIYDFDWQSAERELRRAIALAPASIPARFVFAICLQDQARFTEALTELEAAHAVDPLAPFVGAITGRVYVNARQPDEAIRHLLETLELAPELDVVHQQLGHAYLQKGRVTEAVASLRHAAALSGARDAAQLAYVLAATGQREEAARIVEELVDPTQHPDPPAFHIAMAYSGLGDTDEAFRWLEHAYAERASFMDGVKVTPAFDSLHADPRWSSLLRRMGL